MPRSAKWSTALLLVAACAAQADDRVVPAHEEPRHVPKLQNDWVRVIDVEIPEGEQTMFHRHALDYPYLMITAVTLDNEIPGKDMQQQKIVPGFVGYYRATTQGAYTHRFINRGPGTFRAIGIELLRPLGVGRAESAGLADRPGLVTVIDNERVRAWRITLQPGQSLGPLTLPGPGLRVAMTGGTVTEHTQDDVARTWTSAPAGFVFRDAPNTVTVSNAGGAAVEWVEFEFK